MAAWWEGEWEREKKEGSAPNQGGVRWQSPVSDTSNLFLVSLWPLSAAYCRHIAAPQ